MRWLKAALGGSSCFQIIILGRINIRNFLPFQLPLAPQDELQEPPRAHPEWTQHDLSPDKPPRACLQCSEFVWVVCTILGLFLVHCIFFVFFCHLIQPRQCLSLVWAILPLDCSRLHPLLLYRPDKLQALIWLSFIHHGLFLHLSISSSPDECLLLVWAVFHQTSHSFKLSPHPTQKSYKRSSSFTFNSAYSSTSLSTHPAQMSFKCSSGLFISPLPFSSTFIMISINPDEQKALVWAIFSLNPSILPHPVQESTCSSPF